jgi:hypothetical protein
MYVQHIVQYWPSLLAQSITSSATQIPEKSSLLEKQDHREIK